MSDLELTKIVRPGERVDLQVVNSDFDLSGELDDSSGEKKFYITKIYDITENDRFEVLMPLEKTKLQLLPVGSEYDVYFYAQKGIFTCKAKVAERYKNDNAIVAVLDVLTDVKKHQRREYYRYSTVIGMNTRMLSEAEENHYIESRKLLSLEEPKDKAVIVDISGGGIRYVSAAHYELNRLVQCKFILKVKDENQMFDCVIRILGTKPVANNAANTEYRGQFLFLNNYERESIIRFIFEEERKVRQRR